MSYRLQDDAFLVNGCKSNTKFVLVTLAKYANDMTGECYPSHRTIASIVGISRQSVVEKIQELVSLGYITKSPRGSGFIYKITIPQSSAASSSDKIQQVADKRVSDNPTGSVEKSDRGCPKTRQVVSENPTDGVGKPDTNKEYNKEINKNNNASKHKDIPCKNQDANRQSDSESRLTYKMILNEAKDKLVAEGMSEEDAMSRLSAVKVEFVARVKDLSARGELKKKSSPKGYLVGTLVSMAKEGPKMTAMAECEPRKLDDILVILRKVYKKVYPDMEDKIDGILIVENIPSTTINYIRSQELEDWQGKPSPLQCVRKCLDGWVYGQVHKAREYECDQLVNSLPHIKAILANHEWNRKQLEEDGANESQLIDEDAKIQNSQRRFLRAKGRLQELRSLLGSDQASGIGPQRVLRRKC